jgi:TolB-like protein/Tfp pilus assembly protein PilF
MQEGTKAEQILRFGVFELDLRTGELWKNGMKVRIQEKPFQLLALLLERPGDVVTREELRQKLWSVDTFVDFDHSVNTAVNKLREALGDSANNPRFIQTLARRGYRFIAPLDKTCVKSTADSMPSQDKIRLVVLPLENLSGNPEEEYFVDGMTEELITHLGAFHPERLGVIARSSVMKFKHTEKTISEIGAELDVDYVIEGSIRRAGNRVRTSIQLIQVSDQTHLWAQSYEGHLDNALALQYDLARAISRQIQIKLTPEQKSGSEGQRPLNIHACDAYLKGRFYWNQMSGEGFKKGLQAFEQAIAEDPDYAPAYAGISDCYWKLGQFDMLPPSEAYTKAEANALKALELDDSLAEAHASLGAVRWQKWDHQGAEEEFLRSIELNPSYAIAHAWYSFFLLSMGRSAEAFAEVKAGLTLDPLGALTNVMLGGYYHFNRQYDRAIEQYRKTIDLHPYFVPTYLLLGSALLTCSMIVNAIEVFKKAAEISGYKITLAYLGVAYAMSGHSGKTLDMLTELQIMSKKEYIPPFAFFMLNLSIGKMEDASNWLETAFQQRDSNLLLLKVIPSHDALSSHPKIQSLLQQFGILPSDVPRK